MIATGNYTKSILIYTNDTIKNYLTQIYRLSECADFVGMNYEIDEKKFNN